MPGPSTEQRPEELREEVLTGLASVYREMYGDLKSSFPDTGDGFKDCSLTIRTKRFSLHFQWYEIEKGGGVT